MRRSERIVDALITAVIWGAVFAGSQALFGPPDHPWIQVGIVAGIATWFATGRTLRKSSAASTASPAGPERQAAR